MNKQKLPAFPYTNEHYPGMTLRDYFAAKAMQALIAKNGACHPADAYEMADAMLEAALSAKQKQ